MTDQNCDNPTCGASSSRTFSDAHGNEVEVCDRHYYELVTGESTSSPSFSPPHNHSAVADLDVPRGGALADSHSDSVNGSGWGLGGEL